MAAGFGCWETYRAGTASAVPERVGGRSRPTGSRYGARSGCGQRLLRPLDGSGKTTLCHRAKFTWHVRFPRVQRESRGNSDLMATLPFRTVTAQTRIDPKGRSVSFRWELEMTLDFAHELERFRISNPGLVLATDFRGPQFRSDVQRQWRWLGRMCVLTLSDGGRPEDDLSRISHQILLHGAGIRDICRDYRTLHGTEDRPHADTVQRRPHRFQPPWPT